MSYLLDTCVLSELVKKIPNPKVVQWVSEADESRLFIAALTIGEIHKGIERLPKGKKKERLHAWVNGDLQERFRGRIIDFDLQAATVWGTIQARSELQGKPLPSIDGLIAAMALAHGLTVVTRNTADMEASGVALFNPWG
ncbi:MAG: type II toxin-antitoxin system VapC family toxin [Thermodesulfobacteriota bacterium]